MRSVGLHYLGDIKTAHRQFCKKALQELVGSERGDWATLTFTITVKELEEPIYAVSHRRHGKVHSYVFTPGVTLKGQVSKAPSPRLFLYVCVCGTYLCTCALRNLTAGPSMIRTAKDALSSSARPCASSMTTP